MHFREGVAYFKNDRLGGFDRHFVESISAANRVARA
jgi:hypothetical protein